jgi:plastocyanin
MDYSRKSTTGSIGLFALLFFAASAFGSDVAVRVVDRDGQPVADVAVYAARQGAENKMTAPAKSAVMDQIDKQFVPHLLVVQTGTSVEFPNSDTVAHHVYSFSHPNMFKLPMYKGTAHPPVMFEHSGVVILGCNIHDHMLGYIFVVDSATFTKTDGDGKAFLSLDRPEDYEIRIWSPRIRDAEELLSRPVTSPGNLEPAVSFQLAKKLSPPHGGQLVSWQDY